MTILQTSLGDFDVGRRALSQQVQLSWLEKLGRWQDALASYERAQIAEPRSAGGGAGGEGSFTLGRLRCLSALSEWQQLTRVAEQARGATSSEITTDVVSRRL